MATRGAARDGEIIYEETDEVTEEDLFRLQQMKATNRMPGIFTKPQVAAPVIRRHDKRDNDPAFNRMAKKRRAKAKHDAKGRKANRRKK